MHWKTIIFILTVLWVGCDSRPQYPIPTWSPYDESKEIAANADHAKRRMQYKLIQSKHLDKNEVWATVKEELQYFSPEEYERLKPMILEKSIIDIQNTINRAELTYEQLTLWYLYRIVHMESDPEKTLHTIIALNPMAVAEARLRDQNISEEDHLIYGMPILLKDNINTLGMKTTAGALALKDNQTEDAHIVQALKSKGAIIFGKVNLSEWAYFFCDGCPVGYSAIGGQTLNPYGRRIFETGGSSSGSGTSMAANYAVAAVGTETSGSILSPSGQNSVVGLKPTIGRLSRTGIVPISSTLDTPGPMTRSVADNAIVMDAMQAFDPDDDKMVNRSFEIDIKAVQSGSLKGKRFGAFQSMMEDSIYMVNIEKIKSAGAEVIIIDPDQANLEGFISILNIDMKNDLPKYLETYTEEGSVRNVNDVIDFNLQDTLLRAPYGQGRLEGILEDETTDRELEEIKSRLESSARNYFNSAIQANQLDAVLSINNWSAGMAAVAKYPCLTVPMGYRSSGEPANLTFIGTSFTENKLLELGYAFEQLTNARKTPEGYE